MEKGGVQTSQAVQRYVRYIALITPIVVIAYSVLFFNTTYVDFSTTAMYIAICLGAGWTLLAFLQFLQPSTSRMWVITRFVLYHVFMGAYLVYVTGVGSPIAALWLLLLVASGLYFGRQGVLYSAGVYLMVALAGVLISGDTSSETIAMTTGVGIVVFFSGSIMMNINRLQSVDRHALQQSRREEKILQDSTQTLINSLTDGILHTDAQGVVRTYNASSLSLLDTNTALTNHHIDEVIPLCDSDDNHVSLEKIMRDTKAVQMRDDLWYKIGESEHIRLHITISPVRQTFGREADANSGYILILRDITKEKSLEEERDEFISVVSHELRTPITIVEGSLSNLAIMLDKKTYPADKIKQSVASAHEQALLLAQMINDLSALSRAERGIGQSIDNVDVSELVQKLHDSYAPEAHKKQLQFDLDVRIKPTVLMTSRLYLEELLQNLITNAIKYTKQGSVTLKVTQNKNMLDFAVIDTGIGISKTDQSKIFKKFYRSEDYRTRETSGTGLGLYVAAKLARKLDTTIKVTSRLNHGSTFQFSLPLKNDA